jgi:hypothetical protein
MGGLSIDNQNLPINMYYYRVFHIPTRMFQRSGDSKMRPLPDHGSLSDYGEEYEYIINPESVSNIFLPLPHALRVCGDRILEWLGWSKSRYLDQLEVNGRELKGTNPIESPEDWLIVRRPDLDLTNDQVYEIIKSGNPNYVAPLVRKKDRGDLVISNLSKAVGQHGARSVSEAIEMCGYHKFDYFTLRGEFKRRLENKLKTINK